jgi:hypothetical protein
MSQCPKRKIRKSPRKKRVSRKAQAKKPGKKCAVRSADPKTGGAQSSEKAEPTRINRSASKRVQQYRLPVKVLICRIVWRFKGKRGASLATIKRIVFEVYPYANIATKHTGIELIANFDMREGAVPELLKDGILREQARITGGQTPVSFYYPGPEFMKFIQGQEEGEVLEFATALYDRTVYMPVKQALEDWKRPGNYRAFDLVKGIHTWIRMDPRAREKRPRVHAGDWATFRRMKVDSNTFESLEDLPDEVANRLLEKAQTVASTVERAKRGHLP